MTQSLTKPPRRRARTPGAALACALALFGLVPNRAETAAPGAAIYRDQCASCHGPAGQGVADKYDEPLYGDRSLQSLTRYIERAMPEDDPEACVGEEARQVAEFIYHEFYSPEARQKKGLAAAPRVEFARLTSPQYRNAVADLLAQFTPVPRWPAEPKKEGEEAAPFSVEPGLRAEYFQSKGMSKADALVLERIDPSIDFDFGEGSPAEGITADQFTIIWQGALAAPHTGHYEFRVRTQNGARLYLNSDATERIRKLRDDSSAAGQSALVDAWVSSGEMREQTARVFLLGGRDYPLRLEFFKYKDKTSSIKLEWKPPHGSWAVLDYHHVNTAHLGRTFVVDTSFPADDRSLGYERGSSVSRAWQAAAMNAAIATASEVVDRLPLLAGFAEGSPEREGPLKEFVARLAAAAFRRPLSDLEDQLFREKLFRDAANPEAAVRRAVLLILMSPSFLYTDPTPAGQKPAPHTVAARLSFALWDSIPDRELFEAASQGRLATREQVEAQARRMIADPRAKAKMREFFRHWLEMEERDLAKDKSLFPDFDEAVVADLRFSLEAFIDQVVWSDQSDYRELLLADYLVLNDPLRRLYDSSPEASNPLPPSNLPAAAEETTPGESLESGRASAETDAIPATAEPQSTAAQGTEPAPETAEPKSETVLPVPKRPFSSDFQRVVFTPERRAGVLTHPYLLSAFAYHNNTSPIHRGVFLTRNIVGRALKPPPVAVAFKNDEFPPDITMREKITQLTRDKACMSCHSAINPLGFALENYDAVGRWRTTDNDLPVDTKGQYVTEEGDTLEVQSARDVALFAVRNESAHRAFVGQLFHHLVKQDPAAYGVGTLDDLRLRFAESGFNIQRLMTLIAVRAASYNY